MYEMRKHKIEIRKKYLARREQVPPDVRAGRDSRICKNILSSAAYRFSDVLLLYYPTRGEIDILPVAHAAAAAITFTFLFIISSPIINAQLLLEFYEDFLL